jgi:hypothetical protein
LKGSSSTIREGVRQLRKSSHSILLQGVRMAFIEEEFFHDIRKNLIVNEKF